MKRPVDTTVLILTQVLNLDHVGGDLIYLLCFKITSISISFSQSIFLKEVSPGEKTIKNRYSPEDFNGWNLQITHLERKMIFQTSNLCSMLIFQGCKHCWRFPPPFRGTKISPVAQVTARLPRHLTCRTHPASPWNGHGHGPQVAGNTQMQHPNRTYITNKKPFQIHSGC